MNLTFIYPAHRTARNDPEFTPRALTLEPANREGGPRRWARCCVRRTLDRGLMTIDVLYVMRRRGGEMPRAPERRSASGVRGHRVSLACRARAAPRRTLPIAA